MQEREPVLTTPESHPDHPVVGRDLMGWSIVNRQPARYHCISMDRRGFNLVNRSDPDDVKNVSDAVIGRTFHVIHKRGDHEFSAWGTVTIDENGVRTPTAN